MSALHHLEEDHSVLAFKSGGRKHANRSLKSAAKTAVAKRSKSKQYEPHGRQWWTTAPTHTSQQTIHFRCRFMLHKRAQERLPVLYADSSIPLEWDDVAQVTMSSTDEQCCPICLEPPVAAKITKCWHVFCFACILRHLDSDSLGWNECPLCSLPIRVEELKSVLLSHQSVATVGSSLSMHLMNRFKTSTLAAPVMHGIQPTTDNLQQLIMIVPQLVKYRTVSSAEYIRVVLLREAAELLLDDTAALIVEGDKETTATIASPPAPSAAWTTATADMSRVRSISGRSRVPGSGGPCEEDPTVVYNTQAKQRVLEEWRHEYTAAHPTAKVPTVTTLRQLLRFYRNQVQPVHAPPSTQPIQHHQEQEREQEQAKESTQDADDTETAVLDCLVAGGKSSTTATLTAFAVPATQSEPSAKPPITVASSDTRAQTPSEGALDTAYFYQSSDGQPLFLHPNCIRSLVKQFKGIQNCPSLLDLQILHRDAAVVSEAFHSRARPLSHLPLGAHIEFVELDISPLLTGDTLEEFQQQLHGRQKVRKDQQVREAVLLKRADEAAEKRYKESLRSAAHLAGELEQQQRELEAYLRSMNEAAAATASASSSLDADHVMASTRFTQGAGYRVMDDAPSLQAAYGGGCDKVASRTSSQPVARSTSATTSSPQQCTQRTVWGQPVRSVSTPVSAMTTTSTSDLLQDKAKPQPRKKAQVGMSGRGDDQEAPITQQQSLQADFDKLAVFAERKKSVQKGKKRGGGKGRKGQQLLLFST
eukprot:m.360971 g.360971  ORF g.360971 m.360971 type:complete len:760 (-) comp19258_c0_seq1:397-2676(-)